MEQVTGHRAAGAISLSTAVTGLPLLRHILRMNAVSACRIGSREDERPASLL
jgi:hypothetical protein